MRILPLFPLITSLFTVGTVWVIFFLRSRSVESISLILFLVAGAIVEGAHFTFFMFHSSPAFTESYRIALVFEMLRLVPFISFAFSFSRQGWKSEIERWLPVLIPLGIGILWSVFTITQGRHVADHIFLPGGRTFFLLPESVRVLAYFQGAVLLLGFAQLLRTYLSGNGLSRWNMKYLLIGITLYMVSILLLWFHFGWDESLDRVEFLIETGGLFLLNILILYSLMVQKSEEVKLVVSRSLINRSIVLLLGGVFFFLLAGINSFLIHQGPVFSKLSGSFLLLAGILCFLIVFTSDRLRREIEGFLGVHFYSNRYDYRMAWMTFSKALSQTRTLDDFVPVLVEKAMEVSQAQAVNFCRFTGESVPYMVRTFSLGQGEHSHNVEPIELNASLLPVLRSGVPIHLSDLSTHREFSDIREPMQELFQWLETSWILPLVTPTGLVGLLGIRTVVASTPALLEDRAFFQTLSSQISSFLSNLRVSRDMARTWERNLMDGLRTFVFHDLKNISMTLTLLAHNADRNYGHSDFKEDLLGCLEKVIGRIDTCTMQLLYPTGHEFLAQERIEVNSLIKDILKHMQWGDHPPINVITELSEVPPVQFNVMSLSSTLENLVINAREAVDGQGNVRIRTRLEGANWVMIEVQDNGQGMAPEFLENCLFRPFQTTKERGTGLGLFNSKILIEQNGGGLEANSQVGVGTTFLIKIPRLDDCKQS